MLAYYETMQSGLVPVRVLDISAKDGATLQVTADRYAYKRGETLRRISLFAVIPRGAVRKFKSSLFPKILPHSWGKVLFEGQYQDAPQWRRR